MEWRGSAHLIFLTASLVVLGCATGQPDTGLPPDADPLELARQGLAPFPPERVRIEIEQRVQDLEQSGPDRRGLRQYAAKLTNEWKMIAARMSEEVQFGDWQCFVGGCVTVSRHAAGGSLTQTLAEFSHAEAFLRWNGGKFQGAPQQSPQGLTEVTWIFYAPGANVDVTAPDERFSELGTGRETMPQRE